jgi:transcriptional regulator with XRE-family HTH domain
MGGSMSINETIESAGDRIRVERNLRGLSQAQLADKTGYSLRYLKKVEAGHKPASAAVVARVARVLRIPVTDLTEQPYHRKSDSALHAVVAPLRQELVRYRLPPDDSVRPRSFTRLKAAVAKASKRRHAVNLETLGLELPSLLLELRAAADRSSGPERERLFGLLAEAYYATDQVLSKLGYPDLASTAVDRYEWAAAQSGDELAVLVGDYRRAGELIGSADFTGAQRMLEHSRAQLEPLLGTARPETWSTWGNLHLKSGLAAARAGDRDTADAHLAHARVAAQHTGERDDYRLAFGPVNVKIWSVGLAVELCDGTLAVERAAAVRFPPTTPVERVGHHWIDLARGYQLHGNRERTLKALSVARRVSPQQTRYHPSVHETVITLARQDRRATDSLASFARWAGITL